MIGIALAWLLAAKRFPGRDLVDVLVTAPMVMPPTVLGYYVLVLVGHRSTIGHAYEALTGSTIVFTRTGAVLAASIGALPLVTKSARAALEKSTGSSFRRPARWARRRCGRSSRCSCHSRSAASLQA